VLDAELSVETLAELRELLCHPARGPFQLRGRPPLPPPAAFLNPQIEQEKLLPDQRSAELFGDRAATFRAQKDVGLGRRVKLPGQDRGIRSERTRWPLPSPDVADDPFDVALREPREPV